MSGMTMKFMDDNFKRRITLRASIGISELK